MKRQIKKVIERIRGEFSTEVLISQGLTVGTDFKRQEQCIIDPSHCWLIEIGDNVTLAPRVHILAHDASMWNDTGYTRIAPVKIGNNVFIGAGSIVLPGVCIGDNCIIGAGSVVTKSVPSNSVAAGNPARVLGKQSEFIEKHRLNQTSKPCFDEKYTLRNKDITAEMKEQMKKALDENGFGYVE